MKQRYLDTLRLGFLVKVMTQDRFFTLFPLPEFISLKGGFDTLDIEMKDIPKDFVLKFFVAKNPSSLKKGDFYSLCLDKDDKVQIEKHLRGSPNGESFLLEKDECFFVEKETTGISPDFLDILESLFEVRQ